MGEILTADIGGITDSDGLTNPLFEYQWQRVDGGTPADIAGERSDTYTLTDDDAGTRIRLRVTFRDDSNSQETLTGPATSLIVPEPRLLVGNLRIPNTGAQFGLRIARMALSSGTHPLGYAIDSIADEAQSGPTSSPALSASSACMTSTVEQRPSRSASPASRLVTVTGPDRVSGNLR